MSIVRVLEETISIVSKSKIVLLPISPAIVVLVSISKVPLLSSLAVILPVIVAALVPEVLQDEVRADVLGRKVMEYFENPEATYELKKQFTQLHQDLRLDASAKAARAVLQLIGRG